jgi:T4 beta protein
LDNRFYTPILRWKRGEKICLRELPSGIKKLIWPCLSLRDARGRVYADNVGELGAALHKELGSTPCYLILPALDREMSPKEVLADMQAVIRLAGGYSAAVPAIDIQSISSFQTDINSLKNIPTSLALRVQPAVDFDSLLVAVSALIEKGVKFVHVLVDAETDGSHESKDLKLGLTKLLDSGLLVRVVLAAGTVPLEVGVGSHQIDRPDYPAYLDLVKTGGLKGLCFGDYGVLSPEWREPSGGGGTTPTLYRYTTDMDWLLFKDRGLQGPTIAKLVTLSKAYRGPLYSPGDKAIQDRANWVSGAGRGNAENFLRDSMSQHIVYVSNQLSA